MNKALVELIAQFAVFLELADESEIPLETAVRQQEEMAFRMQKLSAEERTEFVRILHEVAEEEPFQAHREILRRLPEDVGIQ